MRPASSAAMIDAAAAKRAKRSTPLASLEMNNSSARKSFTSPAARQGRPAPSNLVTEEMPETPFFTSFHASAKLLPRGVTDPTPVTTTRRIRELSYHTQHL